MSVHDVTHALSSPPVPRPREAGSIDVVDAGPATGALQAEAVARPPARMPSMEPSGRIVGARPSTEYWDLSTASWRSRGAQTS